jgi:integrase
MTLLLARFHALAHPPRPDDYVVPGIFRKGPKPFRDWAASKAAIDRHVAIVGWRLHDFRRSIVSLCAEQGADIAVLDTLLNHASSATRGGVIGVYQRATLLEPMRRVVALWDGLLREALGLVDAQDKVVALRA